MEAGTLSDTQEDIVRVTYVEIDPQANSVQDIPEANDDDNRTLAISPVPFIIGGAVLLVLLVGIAYRQKRKNSNQDSGATQTGGSQMESQMEQQGSQEFNL
jgi:flagellar biosynthesis/type III secretory pathway M-ring protein FliF/YscJ